MLQSLSVSSERMERSRLYRAVDTRIGRLLSVVIIVAVLGALTTIIVSISRETIYTNRESGNDDLPLRPNLPDLSCAKHQGRVAMAADHAHGSSGEPDPREIAERMAGELGLRHKYPEIRPVYSRKTMKRLEIAWIVPPRKPIAIMSFNRTHVSGWHLGGAQYCSPRR